MKIGIIGAGNIGSTLALHFIKAGHEVAISNSRGPSSLKKLIAELGDNAKAMLVDDAADFGEIVILATPWRSPEALPKPEYLQGKIVIDAMNPYKANGDLYKLGNSTASEETAKRLPGCTLVKAFNTIWFKHLAEGDRRDLPLPERRAIFMAGDDEQAKAKVAKLIEEIGFAAIDTGSLKEGGKLQEPGSVIYNQEITGKQAIQLDVLKR